MENITYCHEHIIIDLSHHKNDPDCKLSGDIKTQREINHLSTLGVKTIIDQTNRGMGRNTLLAQQIADNAKIKLVHSTGYYKEPFLPEECYALSIDELCQIMVNEILLEIPDTGIKAGVIGEIGTSGHKITDIEEKVLRACSKAHVETGATICTHTTLGKLGEEQLSVFNEYSIDFDRIVLSHIDLSKDIEYMIRLLDTGVNIAFDTIGKMNYCSDMDRIKYLKELLNRGYEDQLLMSVDITRQSHYKSSGGIGYGYLIESFIPLAINAGCDENKLRKILCENPNKIYKLA